MKKRKKLLLWLAAAAMTCSVLSATPAMAETAAENSETAYESRTEAEAGSTGLAREAEEVQGTFVLVGDQAHGENGHDQFQVWLELPFTAEKGQTVYDVLEKLLEEAGYTFEAPDSGYGKYLTSVTSPDGIRLTAGTNGKNSGWMYYVNNISASVSMDKMELSEGDRIQVLYVDDYASDSRIDENYNITGETDQKDAGYDGILPQYASDWNSFRGNACNNGVTAAAGPVSAGEAGLKWAYSLKEPSDWATNLSDPLAVNGQIYIAAGDRLKVLDASGSLVKEGVLSEPVGFTSRIAYAEGMILVPLSGGGVQAVAADTLETVWKAPGKDSSHQALTTLTCADGRVYLGTAVADWSSSYSGSFRCIDLSDGSVIWEYENPSAGYYWSGAAAAEGCVFFAGDDGVLVSADAGCGAEKAKLALSAGVRSSIVLADGFAYVTSTDGKLHQIEVRKDGTFGTHRSVSFAAYSTSTPAVAGGYAYVGGSQADYSGVLAMIDLNTMTVAKTAAAEKEVKSAPLVSTGSAGQTCVYYTSNNAPGALYVFCPETGVSEALYVPEGEQQNYCMASAIADASGTLYYTNDSGTLFAIEKISAPETETTGTAAETESAAEGTTAAETDPAGEETAASETETASEPQPDSPPTGDPSNPLLLTGILLISGSVLLFGVRKRKRA